MKHIFFLLFTIKISFGFSQVDTTRFYYDKEFNEIKSAKKAIYFGKGFRIEDGRYKQIDYYSPQKIQMIGYYKDSKFQIEDGKFEYFYENGKHDYIESFKDGKRIDTVSKFYENGVMSFMYVYDNNTHRRKSEIYYKEDGSESILTKPQYSGGKEEYLHFIESHLKYPEEARKQNIEGEVLVQFRVNKDGSIDDLEVIKSTNFLFNEEAKRVIRIMPKWIPGNRDGKPINMYFSQPVFFKLE